MAELPGGRLLPLPQPLWRNTDDNEDIAVRPAANWTDFGFCGNSPAGGHPEDNIHEKLEPDLSQPSLTVSIATFVDVLATWGSVEMRSPRTRR